MWNDDPPPGWCAGRLVEAADDRRLHARALPAPCRTTAARCACCLPGFLPPPCPLAPPAGCGVRPVPYNSPGHTKGVLLWGGQRCGYLVHSVPKWPAAPPAGASCRQLSRIEQPQTERGQSFLWVELPRGALQELLAQLRHMQARRGRGLRGRAEAHSKGARVLGAHWAGSVRSRAPPSLLWPPCSICRRLYCSMPATSLIPPVPVPPWRRRWCTTPATPACGPGRPQTTPSGSSRGRRCGR